LDYKLPKWFYVMNSLQHFVCEEVGVRPGDYIFYATSMENDFLDSRLTFLLEMGVPRSAIAKIQDRIGEMDLEEQIVDYIRKNMESFGFSEYEAERVADI